MSIDEVRLEEVIEAVQEALVTAEAGGEVGRWDDLEREAFAHDVATSYVARRARAAIEAGSSPMELAAEHDLIRRAIAAYFHAGKFQGLLDIDGVTDIMINAHDAIWLQRVDGASSATASRSSPTPTTCGPRSPTSPGAPAAPSGASTTPSRCSCCACPTGRAWPRS